MYNQLAAEENAAALEALVVDEPATGLPEPSRARTAKARRGSVFAKVIGITDSEWLKNCFVSLSWLNLCSNVGSFSDAQGI